MARPEQTGDHEFEMTEIYRSTIYSREREKEGHMAAIEEHKPAEKEKRRALGRGLDALLPSGPRVVAAAPAVVPPPVVSGSAAPALTPASGPAIVPQLPTVPGEVAELHPEAWPEAALSSSNRAPQARGQEIIEISLDLIEENPYQTRRTFD